LELQFEKRELPVLSTAVREVRRTELTQEVKLSEGMPDIGRVLTSWGQVLLRSKEWNRGELGLSGAVMVWTMYLPEDGTEPRSVESWIPFNIKWEIPAELREGPIHGDIRLRFVDGRGISSRKIMIRCGVSALCHGYTPDSATLFVPGDVPEDIQLLKRTYPARIPREAGEKTFLLDEELTIPEDYRDMEKVLSAALDTGISEAKLIGGRVAFKGSGNLHLICRCGDGKIRNLDFEVPFSQYAELDREYSEDGIVDVQAVLTSLETDFDIGGPLRLKAGLVGQYRVDENLLLEVLEDAYSTKREVQLHKELLEVPAVLDDRRELITARQQIPGQTHQCLDAAYCGDFPSVRCGGDSVRLEIPGMFQVLLSDEDGTMRGTVVRWEGTSTFAAGENIRLEVTAEQAGQPEATAGGEELNVQVPVRLRVRTVSQAGIPMVSGLEIGEIKEQDEPAPSLILARADGEELWNLAKR